MLEIVLTIFVTISIIGIYEVRPRSIARAVFLVDVCIYANIRIEKIKIVAALSIRPVRENGLHQIKILYVYLHFFYTL